MLDWIGIDQSMKMREISRVQDKKLADNNKSLKHLCQAHIVFGSNKDVYENGFIVGTESMVRLEKSKLSPKFIDIPCYIDITDGGKIDITDSFVKYLIRIDLVKTGAYYNIKDTIDNAIQRYPILNKPEVLEYKKSYRKAEFYNTVKNDKDLLNLLQIYLIDYIDDIYPSQRSVNGNYQEELKKECRFFNEESDSGKLSIGAISDVITSSFNKDDENDLINSFNSKLQEY